MIYKCPYCNFAFLDGEKIMSSFVLAPDGRSQEILRHGDSIADFPDAVTIDIGKCPECQKTSIHLESHFKSNGFSFSFSYPPFGTKSIPDYVPDAIRVDYQEAVAIVELSPKASAALARRCLQGMIRDFWSIKAKSLFEEIAALKENIPVSQWLAIDAVRKIGNIGAHMEKDVNLIVNVEPDEARVLLKLIELLVDKWYVARHDEEILLSNIAKIAEEKQALRKLPSADSK